jgi:26S proteasome non-ATPase regulatory subunit 9
MPRILDNETSSKNEEEVLRKSLASLDVQRKSMEQEADVIYLELTTPPSEGVEPMGVDTPMIDQEGYPRGDIDVYRARSLRQRFRVLQTDHKALARNIEGMLLQLAAYKVSSVR